MARIIVPTSPIISKNMLLLVQQAIALRDLAERTKDIADEVTGGGVTKANLQTSSDVVGVNGAPLADGTGAVIYDAIVTMLGAVSSVSVKNVIKAFDQG